jgi:uncharacterized caspase-like protein
LQQGLNRVEIIATNRKGVESRVVAQDIEVNDPLARAPELYVLAVGINDYRDHAFQLKYAAQDAEEVLQLLEKQGRSLFKQVHPKLLLNRAADRAGIIQAMRDIAMQAQPQDVLVWYLSGHGLAKDARYYFAPADFIFANEQALREGSIDHDTLQTLLREVKALKSALILDTCHAGTATLAMRGMENKTALGQLMHRTGSAVLAAASDNQMALEGYQNHGLFTYALLQGLRGAADAGNDRQITVNELAEYVGNEVPRLTLERFGYEQFPMHEMHGQSFPLIVVGE